MSYLIWIYQYTIIGYQKYELHQDLQFPPYKDSVALTYLYSKTQTDGACAIGKNLRVALSESLW